MTISNNTKNHDIYYFLDQLCILPRGLKSSSISRKANFAIIKTKKLLIITLNILEYENLKLAIRERS
jgi:hypothetical protein